MKDLDYKTLQALIKGELDTINFKYIIIFIIINLVIAIVNWLIQKNIKNIENNIYKKKVREDRRINIIEEIYRECVTFTYILTQSEMTKSIKKIAELEKKLSENRLYINNKMNNRITNYLDYLKNISSDFRLKNFDTEKTLLNSIEKEFNK